MIKLLGATGLVAAGLLAGMTSLAVAQDTIIVSMKGPGAGNPFWAAVQRGAGCAGRFRAPDRTQHPACIAGRILAESGH